MRRSEVASLIIDGVATANRLTASERHRLAVALILLSGVSMAGMMTALKLAADVMSLWQVMVLRTGIGALLCVPVFLASGTAFLPVGQFRLYALRIALAAGGITFWIYSIAHLPLGVASAISFSKGLFVLWLGALLLGERITKPKFVTTFAGFVGVLMVLDPNGGGTVLAGLAGVAGALFGALLTVVIKRLSATEPTLRMMFYPLAGTALLFAVPAALDWQPMDFTAVMLAGAMVVMGSISQWCFISAYRFGEVTALAPVEYSRLVMAVLAGLAVFGEIPTPIAVVGMLLIAGASYAALRYNPGRPMSTTSGDGATSAGIERK